ncbi:glutamate--cysteine ligase regulatory subunit-like [Xenia sp. Carnegie-2017]|uniref:glutamate--cysteine ligase regulatory subunit-like n=1 Tax=Xenia sp. Carnegie-2017 TaxID=2897299 RepID=UPI001F04874B|nr:glutamate--cysteine ligase regulatory subunit-like [Xenia sp. Carnegie-2017]
MQFIFLDLTELGIDYIDVVVLSIPPFLDAETQISVIRPMWRELEKLIEQSYVGDLAVCDFSMLALKQLCGFAKIKPSYDQINLASCCVMPQFGKSATKSRLLFLTISRKSHFHWKRFRRSKTEKIARKA